MRKISTAELARMTDAAEESLNDTCAIYAFNGTADSLGEITQSWDSGTLSVACGFVESNEYRNERGQIVSIDADALLRLAVSQSIAVKDKVVARSKTYFVDGVTPGRNVQMVALKEYDL